MLSSACCTQMTGTSSARALSISALMLSTTRSASYAGSTTSFCMSMTTRAVLGRSFSVVIACSSSWSGATSSLAHSVPARGLAATSAVSREAGLVILGFDDVELHLDRYEVWRAGEQVAVEPQVFDVLAYLATTARG